MNFVSGGMNVEFNFRFHVLQFTVILCEGNEMIQRVLVTGPYEENIVNKTKPYQREAFDLKIMRIKFLMAIDEMDSFFLSYSF